MFRITESTSHYDVVIVGARCAGAATAMLLARQGLRVLAVDRGQYGSDTLSTFALMRAGVLQLHRWGVLPAVQRAGTPPVRRAVFHYGDDAVEVPIKPRDGVDALYAPRRTVLDRLLVDAAVDAGATVAHGVRLANLLRSPEGRVQGVVVQDATGQPISIRADLVIGADGMRSTVGRLVDAQPYRLGRHASGVVYALWPGLDVDAYHWFYRPGVSVGAIPTNDGSACVFVATSAQRFRDEVSHDVVGRYHHLLRETAPGLAARVSWPGRRDMFHGFSGQVGFFRQSWGPGWALVGDAGYFKDPITAHGITDALRDAELLANAVVLGGEAALADYQAERDAWALELFEVTDRIASYEWDLAAVQGEHRALAEEMSRETRGVAALAARAPAMSAVASA